MASRDVMHALWDELAEFGDADKSALDHLLEGLCFLVGAQNAIWVAAVRLQKVHPQDPLKGWRPHTTYHLRSNPEYEQRASEINREIDEHEVDICTIRQVAQAGSYRTNRICDLADEAWYKSDFYRASFLATGIADVIWSSCPVSKDAEVYFGVQRYAGQPPFTEEERGLVGETVYPLKWFHRQEMLNHGLLIASTPLTGMERSVLEGVLAGDQEKNIADSLGQSYHTTHQHVKNIYRKFGVSNRASLMALWLGRGS